MPLAGIGVVCIAVYVPALVAAQRLRELGAAVTIVEPPAGDPLATMCPAWYDALHTGQTTCRLDLKSGEGSAALHGHLAHADLLLTALRPSALDRLGLGWAALHARHPALSHVAIVGYPAPAVEEPGHDLTYQAHIGLVHPPEMPRTLLADLAGAERAALAAVALLLGRARGQAVARHDVALADAVESFADPLRYGIAAPGALLGGGSPSYGLYQAADGWVAVAALEPHFWRGLLSALDLPADADRPALERAFRARGAEAWDRWAADRRLPLVAVRPAPVQVALGA